MKTTILKILVILSLMVMPAVAGAALVPEIDFHFNVGGGGTGNINYVTNATGSPLTGSRISIDFVTGVDTPSNAGNNLTLSNAVLSFQTGDNAGGWNWSGTSSQHSVFATITGDYTYNNVSYTNQTLFTASYVDGLAGYSTPKQANVISTTLQGIVNPNIQSYFGLSSPAFQGSMVFIMQPKSGTTFIKDQQFTDAKAVSFGSVAVQPVPIPGSFMLLGPGLAGLVMVRKRIWG